MNSEEREAPDSLLVGWATRDITPDGKVRLMGQFAVRVSTRVESPLSCTALAIEGRRGAHAVLVSVDAAYVIDPVMQECRRRIAAAVPGLDPYSVCVSTTHTHTAPCQSGFWHPEELPKGVAPDQQYADLLTDRISEVIKEAWNARAPAQVSWGWAQAVVAHNRRVHYEEQVENPTYDAEIHVLRIGDMAMTFVSPEVYLDYGLRIQERSPAVQTFTVQLLAQDNDNPGYYLPTERAVKAGDCGGNIRDNLVGPEGGQVLVDSLVKMLNEMWLDE